MFLLFSISAICFALSFGHLLTKPIISYSLRPNRQRRDLDAEIADLKQQLSQLSMKNDYTNYVKLERKIVAAETQQQKLRELDVARNLYIKYGISYGIQVVLTLLLIGISITYRYVPVIVLGDQFNFSPFSWLMRFPTGVRGAVSAHFWIFVNTFVAKGVSTMCAP